MFREQFEKLVISGKLAKQNLEPLVKLAECGYCLHKNWGVGKIISIDPVFGRITIDFKDKKGHEMEINFAVSALKPISKDHILAKKLSNLQELREMAAKDHSELLKLVLKSFGGKATISQIQQVLVPDVIEDDWKKWWENVKAEVKHDGHITLPRKMTDPIVYNENILTVQDRLMEEFRTAKGLKARLVVVADIIKNLGEFTDLELVVQEVVEKLNTEIASHQRTQPHTALEAIFLRDDLISASKLEVQHSGLHAADIWRQTDDLATIIDLFPAPKHKRLLQTFKESFPDKWLDIVLDIINRVSARSAIELAHVLIENGRLEVFKEKLARLINQHQASCNLLYWLAKERSDYVVDILGPEVFRAMLSAIDRERTEEKKSNPLVDLIVDDPNLVVDLLSNAEIDVIKDIIRSIQTFQHFTDMDKRSLLARIVKNYPATQALISSEQSRHESYILVSWESLEQKKKEYDELVQVKIPANSKEIAHARSYGDLSENFEYKAAKDMQKLLLKKKSELEALLVRARGTDFSNPRTDIVSIGTRVTLTELNSTHQEAYSILGAWDFDAEKRIVSYLSPIAQALLNKKVGDIVEFESDNVKKVFRIDAIEPAIKRELAISTAQEPQQPQQVVPAQDTTLENVPSTGDLAPQTTVIETSEANEVLSKNGDVVQTPSKSASITAINNELTNKEISFSANLSVDTSSNGATVNNIVNTNSEQTSRIQSESQLPKSE